MDEMLYLQALRKKLLHPDNWHSIQLTRTWTKKVPPVAGVYILKENGAIIYVGESGNLRKRMEDLLDSRHHTVRRTLGEKLFASEEDFVIATTKKKFPARIETLLNDHIGANLSMAYIPVTLGRKELEELIVEELRWKFVLINAQRGRVINKGCPLQSF